MTERIYTDRSRVQAKLRCARQRWWEYHSGPQGRGIVPVRKSLHIIVGLGFHAGAELLLRASSQWLSDFPDQTLEDLFVNTHGCVDGKTVARQIEDAAVERALAEMAALLAAGVEVDLQEQPEKKAEGEKDGAAQPALAGSTHGTADMAAADSPIVIDFAGDGGLQYGYETQDFSQPIYPSAQGDQDSELRDIELHAEANLQAATGVDDYLKLELAALVEGMIRAYARRRLMPLMESHEVLEVEREGSWKLGEHKPLRWDSWSTDPETPFHTVHGEDPFELWWMSRPDALLLERQTNQLYLLSYKTTGAWDRRKRQDAEIDMQGLSEAVDVEKRLGEAYKIIMQRVQDDMPPEVEEGMAKRLAELVSPRIEEWLSSQPSPPRILGVRYEYILKGARRQDKKDPLQPGRYVQDSPLVRAYRSDGITAEDRRWAPSYEWFDATGKQRRIDYRSWRKAAVWETMPIAQWIDLLDAGDYWPGKGEDYDEHGNATDVLGDQFISPIVVWRQEDDMRDMLEQIEAQEVQVVLDVQAVRSAEQQGEGEKRSALNRLFSQTRTACNWYFGGVCPYKPICYGGEDIRRDPLNNSDKFQSREANHPIEMAVTE